MASSQQYLVLNHAAQDESYKKTDLRIDDIRVAQVDKIQVRFPELNQVKENRFSRTRIDFQPTIVGDQKYGVGVASSYLTYNKYVEDDEVVLFDIVRKQGTQTAYGFPRAGPRRHIPVHTAPIRAAIVCSGSLCPGQNDVIGELFNCLYYNYGVDTIYGIHGGFRGFYTPEQQPWDVLTPEIINDAIGQGGSILASNPGGFDPDKIIEACRVYGVTQLYLIGGDGSHLAANTIDARCKLQKILLQTICVPCSVENDLAVIDSSFGFGSALSGALDAIQSAIVEARCAPNGIGIVSVTGKHCGYLACHSVLASNNVCACLIPESPFILYGQNGLLEYLHKVVQRMGYAVIVVAEGAAKDILHPQNVDNCGNDQKNTDLTKSAESIDQDWVAKAKFTYNTGISPSEWIKQEIEQYFKKRETETTIRIISALTACRSMPANPSDRVHCLSLSNNAVHAAMYGYTNFSSTIVNNRSVLVPASIISRESPSALKLDGRTFERVTTLTQQPQWTSSDRLTEESAKKFVLSKRPSPAPPQAKL